jgi:4-hydroxy-3-polyprenylbenzoate decarboxylase
MLYRDLHDFLHRLDEANEVRRVGVEVDSDLEIAEIVGRVSKMEEGGAALLFEKVKDSRFPVVANLFGTYKRICMALGIEELNDLARRMDGFVGRLSGNTASSWWEHIGFMPRLVQSAPCQEVADYAADLGAYPFLKSWPEDSGRAVLLPLVVSEDPDSHIANCGMYRVQILGQDTAAIHWQPQSGGARHFAKYLERGERMPVAIAIGGDPAMILSASLPLPEMVDEMQFAGFLRKAPVELVRCLTSPLLVPAHAELVIEGYIESGEMLRGSLFGNHTGFYASAPDAPILQVTCITRKNEPLFPATVVGMPPMEDCWLAKAAERLMLPFIRRELPEIVDINFPLEWIFHSCAVVAIAKASAGHGREVLRLLRESRWLRHARLLVIVDADLNVQDLSRVAWKALNNVDWQRDLLSVEGPNPKIHADSPFPVCTSLLGIDATRKWPGERDGRPWPREITMDDAVVKLVDARWKEYGF